MTESGAWSEPLAVGTFVLALATLLLVLVTGIQLRLARRTANLAIRPLLGEVPEPLEAADIESVSFGAPGRNREELRVGEFFLRRGEDSDVFQVSVSFRNVGSGPAVILGAGTDPAVTASCKVSRMYVPTGENVRVNVSALVTAGAEGARHLADWRTEGGANFTIFITYADVDGSQTMTTRAVVREYAVHTPFVERVEIWRPGAKEPYLASGEWGG
ncbi:MAG: hypothetical protein QOG53_3616 [Frankiales bacterium]|jgi:hypothetical protein|nr:hypothetical protein [Frankiales bacterium]